jgi:tRNA 2-thiocytidine biosynthesis protein TtcA
MNYPIIPCDLCGSQEGLQRMQVKKLLDDWETRSPGRRQIMFRALMNVRPSHLADPALFDFLSLAPGMAPNDAPADVDTGLPPALR